jgi:hypothetical protein
MVSVGEELCSVVSISSVVVVDLVVGVVVVFLVVVAAFVVGEPPPPPPPPPSRQKGPLSSVANGINENSEHNRIELYERDERTAVAGGSYAKYETLS